VLVRALFLVRTCRASTVHDNQMHLIDTLLSLFVCSPSPFCVCFVLILLCDVFSCRFPSGVEGGGSFEKTVSKKNTTSKGKEGYLS
jgi:hypothetical protein